MFAGRAAVIPPSLETNQLLLSTSLLAAVRTHPRTHAPAHARTCPWAHTRALGRTCFLARGKDGKEARLLLQMHGTQQRPGTRLGDELTPRSLSPIRCTRQTPRPAIQRAPEATRSSDSYVHVASGVRTFAINSPALTRGGGVPGADPSFVAW